jgi:hypothetical protein
MLAVDLSTYPTQRSRERTPAPGDVRRARIEGTRRNCPHSRTRADPHLVRDLASHHILRRELLIRCNDVVRGKY